MTIRAMVMMCALGLLPATATAQSGAEVDLPASPAGLSAIQVAGEWVESDNGPQYRNGRWITVNYSRPILRGRQNIFGTGAGYGSAVKAGEPLWRAGANATTRLTTQVPLQFGGTTVQPGVYNVLVDLKETGWTLVLTTQPALETFDPDDTVNLYGAANYDEKYDVLRAPMMMDTLPASFEQFTIEFIDVTGSGGTLIMMWDLTAAMIPFTVSQ